MKSQGDSVWDADGLASEERRGAVLLRVHYPIATDAARDRAP